MHPVNELDSGRWANMNPSQCECRGGWLLSDYDTWHRCPLHGKGVPHPEDDGAVFDREAHNLRIYRVAYAHFRDAAVSCGMTREAFRLAVLLEIQVEAPTKADWVDAADSVASSAFRWDADRRAAARGYSCRLEAAWAADAAFEQECRDLHLEPETEAHGPLAADRNSWYRN